MKFGIYLCLVILVSQLSVTVQEAFVTSENNMYGLSIDMNIDVRNHRILENSIVKATPSSISLQDNQWSYDRIEYLQTIPQHSPIRLDYTVQNTEMGFFSNSWVSVLHHSVLLCNKDRSTPGGKIVSLVRELLGIPEGCPVPAGLVRNASDVHLPFTRRSIVFMGHNSNQKMRILMNLRYDGPYSTETIFEGHFYPTINWYRKHI